MVIAAVADWIMGNTVSSVVFATFGMLFSLFSISYRQAPLKFIH